MKRVLLITVYAVIMTAGFSHSVILGVLTAILFAFFYLWIEEVWIINKYKGNGINKKNSDKR